jgi:predicted phage terminase large subunit-like protein
LVRLAAKLTPAQIAALSPDERGLIDKAVEEHRLEHESLLDFVPRVSPGHIAPAHLQQLVDLLDRIVRGECLNVCISIPPGHGKTDLLLHLIARYLVAHPAHLVGYVTYGLELSYPKSREARGIALAAGVQLAGDSSAVQEWNTTAGGGLKATAVGAGFTGRHVDLLIIDDPFKNRDDAESQLQRDRVYNFYSSTASTRCKANASQIVVHTRWHEDDLIGRLSKMAGWIVVNVPAISVLDPETGDRVPANDNAEGDVLLPQVRLASGSIFGYSREWLSRQRALNEYDWWALYQGRPRRKGGKVFAAEVSRYLEPDLDDAKIVLSVDAAGTESTSADFTVAMALAIRGAVPDGEMAADILDVLRMQLEPKDAAPKLYAFQLNHGNGVLLIEATRDGKALEKALKAIEPKLRIKLIPPIGDKFTRAQPVASAWNKGRIRVPVEAPWVPDLLAEFEKFTGLGDKHDDQVDALSQGWNHVAPAQKRTPYKSALGHSARR